MLTRNQAQSISKESPKILPRILVIILCVMSAIFIWLVDLKTTINSVTVELMSDQERPFRLYYDTGSGYNDKESVAGKVLRRQNQSITYHFPVPSDKVLIAIRIDPDEEPTRYLIKSISLNYLYDFYHSTKIYPHLTWNSGQIEKLFIPLHNVKPFVLQQGHLVVETNGPDPYLGTKESLLETWKRLRNERHPFNLPLKIGGYLFLALMAIMFFYHRFVSNGLKITIPLILGVLAFLIVAGPRILSPTNIGWLENGDPATHYLGWVFFSNSEWSFPVGLNPTYGLELSNAILFSDSNPLLAFLFKPFAPLLSHPFQYSGIWILVCFVLQSWFGWKLVGLISDSLIIRTLASGLFVFSPPMILRINQHMNLAGHFLILASLYLVFHRGLKRRQLAWGTLLAVTAMVHSYLFAMIGLVWLADLFGKTVKDRLSVRTAILEITVITSVIGIICWQTGYFSVSDVKVAGSFGFYRMNLLSIVDPWGASYVLKDIPSTYGEWEGFNFLGLGVIFLFICTLPVVIANTTGVGAAIRRFPVLFVVFIGLTVFAATNQVGFGPLVFEYPLPDRLFEYATVFRNSGRMFWPVFYAIVFVVIFLVVRGHNKRTAVTLLGLALLIQIVDTSASWTHVHKGLMDEPKSEWVTPLVNPFWQDAALKYRKVRWFPQVTHIPRWQVLAAYAAKYGLSTDSVYLGRIDSSRSQRKSDESLKTGKFDADSIYFLKDDDAVLRQVALIVDHETDLLAKFDGFNVLAPGWKKMR
jgi:hypothetical protein